MIGGISITASFLMSLISQIVSSLYYLAVTALSLRKMIDSKR